MPYQPHMLAVFRGTLGPTGVTTETWSFGLRFAEEGGAFPLTVPGYTQATADAMFTALKVLIANTSMLFSSDVEANEVRLYDIDTNGRAASVPIIGTGTIQRGATGSNKWPWQCSLVLTLQANGLGKGRFGRIYLPPMGINIGNDGLIGSTLPGPMLTALQTFLLGCANATGLSGAAHLCIMGSTGTAGTARQVNKIRLGRVVDTQRRRRRSLAELYTTEVRTE